MDKDIMQSFIVKKDITIVDAMQRIDENAGEVLYVVDEDSRLLGSVSDGDIRRWIMKTGDLKAPVELAMCKEVKYFTDDMEIPSYNRLELDQKGISSMPVLKNRQIVDIISFRKYTSKPAYLKGTPVVIMAGGKGTRLYPYTKILPKPLIPVGDIPILERILQKYYEYGVHEFFLTVNYRKEMIKAYLKEIQPPYKLHFVEEDMPLGTAGSLALIKRKFTKPVIISNCDIIIETDYGKIIEYHNNSGNDMTVVSSVKNTNIPYGVIHSKEDGIITSIEEKPRESHLVSTGMYVLNPSHIGLIPPGIVFHMTDLMEKMMDLGCRIGTYPISENSFLDMGEMEELKKMEERMNGGSISR